MGVIAALERAGFEPGDDVEIGGTVFELDPVLMPVAVVKLGSSIVATDSGELRLSVVGRICEEIAELHRSGVDVVIVTSGAIARGIHLLGLGTRPRVVEELQAASAVGQGRLYRTYDEYLRECGIQSAQVLLTFFDMSARTHYLNARRTLRKLVDWRIVPVINENDTTTTDEISFGDNDFLAAQVAVLVDASLLLLLTSAPRGCSRPIRGRTRPRGSSRPCPTRPSSRRCRSPPRRRRWARAGCARRSRRPRWRRPPAFPTVIGSRLRAGRARPRVGGGGDRDAVRAAPGAPAVVQAVAQVREAVAGLRHGRRGRCARAARGRHVAAAGRDRRPSRVRSRPATPSTSACTDAAVGKGISNYSAAELRRVMGMKSGEVREVLPRATDEAVHRDYFVLA